MFLNGFRHVPGAGHSRGKGDKVSLSKGGGFSPIGGRNGDLPLQQVGTLVRVVGPRKLGGLATPGSFLVLHGSLCRVKSVSEDVRI